MGAVFLFFIFVLIFFLFPHKTGGVCKCASAIWTLSGVGFEEKLQASQHGQDPLTGPLYVVVDPETWSTMERRRENQGRALFCGGRSAGLQNPRGNWEGAMRVHLASALVFTSTLMSTHTLPSPTHLCTFVHSSCEVPFWGWEHNYNRRIATTSTKSLKRNSQTEIRDSRSTSSPTSCI